MKIESIPKERLAEIKAGAIRWHATSTQITLSLIAEIERLQIALDRAESIVRMREERAKGL